MWVRDYETALQAYNAQVSESETKKREEPVEKEIKEQIKEETKEVTKVETKEVTKEETKEIVPEIEQEQPGQKRFAEYELPFKIFFENVHTSMQKAIPADTIDFLQADEEQRTLLAVAAKANPDLTITRGKRAV